MEVTVARRDAVMTVLLCYLTAVMEGVDLQSMAIAAPKLRPELGLNAAQFGTAASMSLVGLLIGSIVGGRLADRTGRRGVLVGSLAALGLFSLLTTAAHSYGQLVLIRLLVGLGLGGSFPILIALASEVARPDRRATTISLMYAGVPMGTIIGTSMILYFGNAYQWRWIFYIGGIGPLILAPVLLGLLPESASFRSASVDTRTWRTPVMQVLFAPERRRFTLLLWLSYACTLLVVYLMTNWLNQLMSSRGLNLRQSNTVLLGWGVGSIAGTIALGILSDAKFRRWSAIIAYSGIALSLIGLSQLSRYELLVACGFGAGFFAVGSNLVNYALAPLYYPVAMRGTGVGWAVAIGRLGSIFGPYLGGVLLQAGLSASGVLVAFLPALLIAATTTTMLLFDSSPNENGR